MSKLGAVFPLGRKIIKDSLPQLFFLDMLYSVKGMCISFGGLYYSPLEQWQFMHSNCFIIGLFLFL